MNNIAICITAGEQSENHAGMQINGNGLSNNGWKDSPLKSPHGRPETALPMGL